MQKSVCPIYWVSKKPPEKIKKIAYPTPFRIGLHVYIIPHDTTRSAFNKNKTRPISLNSGQSIIEHLTVIRIQTKVLSPKGTE